MELRSKPLCEFGAKCYRKNPKHLESYSHPPKDSSTNSVTGSSNKTSPDVNHEKNQRDFSSLREKKTTKDHSEKSSSVTKPQTLRNYFTQTIKKQSSPSSKSSKKIFRKRESNRSTSIKKKRKERTVAEETQRKKTKTISSFNTVCGNDESLKRKSDSESVSSMSSTFTRNNSHELKTSSNVTDLKNKTVEEKIKTLFLVDMPPDFYSFYEFCNFVKETLHLEPLQFGELKLVGPFDILSSKIFLKKMDYSLDPDSYLRHWRFYYDPPEFQTVLAAESGYHIGYWRDDPKENPVFLASNNSNENCTFKIEAENIFGAVFHYLKEFTNRCDPFMKVKTEKLQLALKNWVEKNDFTLEKKTSNMSKREKKIVSKTFHGAGIVVPVEAKTELGYRPLIETDAALKKICELIMKADDENERESLWENLHPLITAANIANDECDFGNGLELGIDLFSMGSPVFHETAEYLLTTAYSLLNRPEFEKIIRAHLKFRRKEIQIEK